MAAAVRGIATSGPMQSIISKASTVTTTGFTFLPRSVNDVPNNTTVRTPRKGETMPVVKNPATAASHSSPAFSPINGGKIRFPAPKNIANNAKPKVTAVPTLFFNYIKFENRI